MSFRISGIIFAGILLGSGCKKQDSGVKDAAVQSGSTWSLYWPAGTGQDEVVCRADCDQMDLKNPTNKVRAGCNTNVKSVPVATIASDANMGEVLKAIRYPNVLVASSTAVTQSLDKLFTQQKSDIPAGFSDPNGAQADARCKPTEGAAGKGLAIVTAPPVTDSADLNEECLKDISKKSVLETVRSDGENFGKETDKLISLVQKVLVEVTGNNDFVNSTVTIGERNGSPRDIDDAWLEYEVKTVMADGTSRKGKGGLRFSLVTYNQGFDVSYGSDKWRGCVAATQNPSDGERTPVKAEEIVFQLKDSKGKPILTRFCRERGLHPRLPDPPSQSWDNNRSIPRTQPLPPNKTITWWDRYILGQDGGIFGSKSMRRPND